MSRLKGTKTLENLMKAFAGESQARNRYTMFASVANSEGHPQIEKIFLDTAENERQHAKQFYKFIVESFPANTITPVHISASYPAAMGDTLHNLKAAAEGEHEEFAVLYKESADVAAQEGFNDIALMFRLIAEIEWEHEERYRGYAKALENGTLYKKDHVVEWRCSKCGHLHKGESGPKVCPVCAHPQGYFEVFVKNY